MSRLMCQQPDRDEPRLTCGYPLPCPWHTVVLDVSTATVKVPTPVKQSTRRRLRELAAALKGKRE